jgi:hypothetical protein
MTVSIRGFRGRVNRRDFQVFERVEQETAASGGFRYGFPLQDLKADLAIAISPEPSTSLLAFARSCRAVEHDLRVAIKAARRRRRDEAFTRAS